MVVISHAKLQTNVWMFVNEWKWYSGISEGPLPSPAVLWIVTMRERKIWYKKKKSKCYLTCQIFSCSIYSSLLSPLSLSSYDEWKYLHKNFVLTLSTIQPCSWKRIKLLKEVQCNCSAHRSAHFFIIALRSHSHIKWNLKNYLWRKIHELNT